LPTSADTFSVLFSVYLLDALFPMIYTFKKLIYPHVTTFLRYLLIIFEMTEFFEKIC